MPQDAAGTCPNRFVAVGGEGGVGGTCEGLWPLSCQVDTDCPQGTHCSEGKGKTCDWTCRSNADCGEGETCDCTGRCFSPNLAKPRGSLTTSVPSLTFSITDLEPAAAQSITMSVVVPDEDEAGPLDEVVAVASSGFEVACPERDSAYEPVEVGTFKTSCNVDFGSQARGVVWVRNVAIPSPGNPTSGRVALRAMRGEEAIAIAHVGLAAVANTPVTVASSFAGWYEGVVDLEGLGFSPQTGWYSDEVEQADSNNSSNLLGIPVLVYVWDDFNTQPKTSSGPSPTLKAKIIDVTKTLADSGVLYVDLGNPDPEVSMMPEFWGGVDTAFIGPVPATPTDLDLGSMVTTARAYTGGSHASGDVIYEPDQFLRASLAQGTIDAILPLSLRPYADPNTRATLVWSLRLSRIESDLPAEVQPLHPIPGSVSTGLEPAEAPEWLAVGAKLFGVRELGRESVAPGARFWWRRFLDVGNSAQFHHQAHEAAMWNCLNSPRALSSQGSRMYAIHAAEISSNPIAFQDLWNALASIGDQSQSRLTDESSFLYSLSSPDKDQVLRDSYAICYQTPECCPPANCSGWTPDSNTVPPIAYPSCDTCSQRLYKPCSAPTISGENSNYAYNACIIEPYTDFEVDLDVGLNRATVAQYRNAARCSVMVATLGAESIMSGSGEPSVTALGFQSPTFVPGFDDSSGDLLASNVWFNIYEPDEVWENPWMAEDVPWQLARSPGSSPWLVQLDQSVPGYTRSAANSENEPSLNSAHALYDTCLSDLNRAPPEAPAPRHRLDPLLAADIDQRVSELFQSRGCVDLGRFVHEVDWLSTASEKETTWYYDWTAPLGVDKPSVGSRRLLWRFHQWLTLHAFVARHGAANDPLDRVLAVEGREPSDSKSLVDVLRTVNKGWSMLLYPRYSRALLKMSPEWVSDPDYRKPLLGLGLTTETEHGRVLPITILETAAAHLDLARRYVESRRADIFYECKKNGTASRDETMTEYGRAARAVILAESFATEMANRTSFLPATPAWMEEYNAARARLGTAWDRVRKEVDDAVRCRNPLGIADGSLPLYFVDPAGVNQRFFAVSDYLLNAWAAPAVASAREALNKARSAWLQRRDADIAQARTEVDQAREFQSLKQTYGARIREACGLEMTSDKAFEAYERGEIDITTCFRPTDEPGCQTLYEKLWKQTLSQLDPRSNPSCGVPDRVGLRGLDALKNACMLFREYVGYAITAPWVKGYVQHCGVNSCWGDEFFKEQPNAFSLWEEHIIKYPPGNGPRNETNAYPLRSENQQWLPLYEDYRILRNLLSDVAESGALVKFPADAPAGVSTWHKPFFEDVGTVSAEPILWKMLRDLSPEQLEPVRTLKVDVCSREIGFQIGAECETDSDCQSLRCFEGKCSVVSDVRLMLNAGAVWAGYGWKSKPGDCSGAGCETWNKSILALLEGRHGDFCSGLLNEQLATFGSSMSESIAEASINPESSAQCFRGGLGAIELEILKAKQAIRIAEQGYLDVQSQYEIRGWQCLKGYQINADVEIAQEAFHDAVYDLQRESQVVSLVSSGIGMLVSLIPSTVSTSTYERAYGLGEDGEITFDLQEVGRVSQSTGAGGAVAVPIIGPVLDFLFGFSARQRRIEERNRAVNAALSKLADHQACVADLTLIATKADLAIEQVRAAGLDAISAIARLAAERESIRQHMTEGLESIQRAEAWQSRIPDLRHHFWLSEEVTRFQTELDWAKRLVYLTGLAINYETQSSIDFERDVLGADHPADLEAVIRNLAQEQGTRGINGNRPEEHVSVVSLRDHALRVPSTLNLLPGEWKMTAQEHFAARVLDPLNAIYDDAGEYLGQGIHVRIEPTDAQMYRCAERLWSVNASIIGDMLGVTTPELPIFLLKRNTFESQWCEGHEPENGPTRQIGTLKPSINLLRAAEAKGQKGEESGYSWAYLQAWLNVPRKEFHRDAYSDGASAELAGRGLYGDYIVLFPWWGLLDKGFDLTLLEDVILRFDYLSVSNGSAAVGGPTGGASNVLPWERRPQGLTGVVTPTAVELSWENPVFPSFSGVRVVRRAWAEPETAFPRSAFEGEVVYPSTGHVGGATSFADTEAEAGIVYYYRVFAVDGAGTGYGGFEAFMAEPDFAYPESCVWQLAGTAGVVSWDAPVQGPRFDAVMVERTITSGSTVTRSLSGVVDSPYTNDADSGATHAYKLQVIKGSAVSPESVPCTSPPVVQVDELVIDGSVPIVELSWVNPLSHPGFESVRVMRRLGSPPTSPIPGSGNVLVCDTTDETCEDDTALAGRDYSYAVYVKDQAGFYHLPVLDSVTPAFALATSLACAWNQGAAWLAWVPPTEGPRFGGAMIVRKEGSVPTTHTDGTLVMAPATAPHYSENLGTGSVYHYRIFTEVDGIASATGPSCTLTHSQVQPASLSASIPFVASGPHVVRLQWSAPNVGAASYRLETATGSPTFFDPITSPYDWTIPSGSGGSSPSFGVFARDYFGTLRSSATTNVTLSPMHVDGLSCARVPAGSSNIVVSFTTPSNGPLFEAARVVHNTGSYPAGWSMGTPACTVTAVGATSCTFDPGVSSPRFIRVFSRTSSWLWSTTGPSCTL